MRQIVKQNFFPEEKIEKDINKNMLDPFSAIIEASKEKITLDQWLVQEKIRQDNKSFQNAIGLFHQQVLGKIGGWTNLGTGHVVDIICEKRKIIAEIKNKFNTTKGNHKIAIYDDLDTLLKTKYIKYTGYYVAIITKKRINSPFQPPDNKTKLKRPKNESIREIDGKSFYELVTDDKLAINKLYNAIPLVISEITKFDGTLEILKNPLFNELFNKAFNK